MRLGLVTALVTVLAAAVVTGSPALAQDDPAPESLSAGDFPFGQNVEAEVDGKLKMSARPTGFGPGGHVYFPVGGEGVCNPSGTSTMVTGFVGEDNGEGYASFRGVEIIGQPSDVVVTDDGAICAALSLMSLPLPQPGGGEAEIEVDEDGTGFFRAHLAIGRLEIVGTGAFADIIPEGCSLPLTVDDLVGSIDGGTAPGSGGAPSTLIAATSTCGAYGTLLNVAFDLPAAGRIDLETTTWHPAQTHDH